MTWQDNKIDGDYSIPSMFPIDHRVTLPEVGEMILAVIDPDLDAHHRYFRKHFSKLQDSSIKYEFLTFYGYLEEGNLDFRRSQQNYTIFVDDSTIVVYYRLPNVKRLTTYEDENA